MKIRLWDLEEAVVNSVHIDSRKVILGVSLKGLYRKPFKYVEITCGDRFIESTKGDFKDIIGNTISSSKAVVHPEEGLITLKLKSQGSVFVSWKGSNLTLDSMHVELINSIDFS